MKKIFRLMIYIGFTLVVAGFAFAGGDGAPVEDGDPLYVMQGSSELELDAYEGSLKYVSSERIDDENGDPAIRVYCDYTNKKDGQNFVPTTFRTAAYQNDRECDQKQQVKKTEEEMNYIRKISKGETSRIAIVYTLEDETSPVTFTATDITNDNLMDEISDETTVQFDPVTGDSMP